MLRKWFSIPEEAAPPMGMVRNGPTDHSQSPAAPHEEAAMHEGTPSPAALASNTPSGRYCSFEQIYQSAANKLPRISYNILKVAEMVNSSHLSTMSTEAKRCSLLMALEAASVKVEDVLQDAVLRERALSEYEEAQKTRLKNFEQSKAEENAKIQAELEKLTKAHMAKIQANLDELAREQDNFRVWQKSKHQECDRLTDAAGYCVPQGSAIGPNSLAGVLERATMTQ